MSTIKVNKIENTSTTDGGVSIDTEGHVQIDGQQMPTAGPLSNRNLIINGAMMVDQRNSGGVAIGTLTNGKYTVDRWQVRAQDNTTGQAGQSGQAPDDFTNSLLVEVGATAVARSASTNRFVRHNMEGYVTRSLKWGTAAAKDVTISFWVKSSLTGTYSFSFFSGSVDQHYVTNYTIDTADTWEQKTITVPGPTSGTWRTDNGLSVYVHWDLGSGGSYQTSTLNQWGSGDKRNSTTGVDFFNNANASFYLTGVQLEVGSKATPFEHRNYGQELALCQRYYEEGDYYIRNGVANSSIITSYYTTAYFMAEKRIVPTITGTNDQGTFSAVTVRTKSTGVGRSNTVANTNNSGTFVANAEL